MIIPKVHVKTENMFASLDGDPISRTASHFEGVAIFFSSPQNATEKVKATQQS